jgi:AraC-like DNA-binding protein
MATTSQPRSLLSMARLNIARSRVRCSIWSLVRIAQTCFCRNGGLAPISCPLFQGVRLGASGTELASSWSYSSVTEEAELAVRTAGIDLALALVEQDLGRAPALSVARALVMFLKRPGGQAQFSATLSLQRTEDRFGALHKWVAGHLASDLSLPALAQQAGMSERSFSRHYEKATGLTPANSVDRLRVESARRMLTDTRLPIKRIAERCGFGSEETLRRSFVRLLAATPRDYRARFSA